MAAVGLTKEQKKIILKANPWLGEEGVERLDRMTLTTPLLSDVKNYTSEQWDDLLRRMKEIPSCVDSPEMKNLSRQWLKKYGRTNKPNKKRAGK